MKKISGIAILIGFSLLLSSITHAEPPPVITPTYIFLNFEGDPDFPSLTTGRDTSGLARFNGSAFRITLPEQRNNLIQAILDRVRQHYIDFNVEISTTKPPAGTDYYTLGMDDSPYIFVDLNTNALTKRLYGKAGYNPSTGIGTHPKYSRTWAGSFTLPPIVSLDLFTEIEANNAFLSMCEARPPIQPHPIQIAGFPLIPVDPLNVSVLWPKDPFSQTCYPYFYPVMWGPSYPPLIPQNYCTTAEKQCANDWVCGKFNGCNSPTIDTDHVVRALSNNVTHEISHLFGTYDLVNDKDKKVIHPATGNTVSVDPIRYPQGLLMYSQEEYIESFYDKFFDPDNRQILMNSLGAAPPSNPRLTSPTHTKGQPSCEQVLTLQWETPAAVRGVGGYSFTIVSQDNPYYDTNRWPDGTIDLGPSTTSYTTPPLEVGHIWEFNIRTVDSDGRWARFYESFWVEIDSCSVVVTKPHSGDQFKVGDVGDVYWDSMVIYGGNDVGGGYDVASIDLLKGPELIKTLQSNLPNIGLNIFLVPEVGLGSDYRLRIVLKRNASGNMFPGLPEKFIGYSGYFTINPRTTRVSGAAYNYPENPTYRASFSMDLTGPASPIGWLKYYYSRTRLNFISTGISSVSITGNTVNVTGNGSVNGATGYTFTATVVNGTPDTFAITISKQDGSLYYSAGPMAVSGGNFTLSTF